MSLDVEGGAFLEALDRLNLEERALPTVNDVVLAIAAAEFIVKSGGDNQHLTLPELVVVDAAKTFLALTDDPMDSGLWDALLSLKSCFDE